MALFAGYTFAYFLFAALLNLFLRDEVHTIGIQTIARSSGFLESASVAFPFFVLLFLLSYLSCRALPEMLRRFGNALVGVVICCVFLAAFTTVKTSMPLIVEQFGLPHFFADPLLADIDHVLHLGVDPWQVTHRLSDMLGWSELDTWVSITYGIVWAIPAFYLPAIMLFMGEGRRTFVHYTALYLFAWIVLGNLFAVIGNSAGPVYFDRIFLTDRFADLHIALATAGVADNQLGGYQEFLWQDYVLHAQAQATGISAFPSVHLAAITVAALYFQGKGRLPGLFGWLLVAIIMFISVWSGYHYAIDGYFSIAAVFALHRYLVWRSAKRNNLRPADGEAVAAPGNRVATAAE